MIEIKTCPHCRTKNRLPESHLLNVVTCGHCKKRLFPNAPAVVESRTVSNRASNAFTNLMEAFSGKIRPRHVPDKVAELAHIDFVCAVYNRPFTATFAKERLGEKFHVKSLRGRDYRALLVNNGYQIKEINQGSFDINAADWTGFQCEHCGAGRLHGDYYDFLGCPCNNYFCGGRVEPIHEGGLKAFCPKCQTWGMIGTNYITTITASYDYADGQNDNKPETPRLRLVKK